MYWGEVGAFLKSDAGQKLHGTVDLVLTSPPFPLNRKKRYGNKTGNEFKKWLAAFAKPFSELLAPGGSIVLEMGNAWKPGEPEMSTLALESLLAFRRAANLHISQLFVYVNPARLPAPAQWVTVERTRVKDAFTHIWWMSPSPRPHANNRTILSKYSDSMLKLLKTRKYNAGTRHSEYQINETSFLKDNGGAIPSNVIVAANTVSSEPYLEFCRKQKLPVHPARMSGAVPEFFIPFLTKEGGLIFDPFGGSNTTGAVAERLGRRWCSVELNGAYVYGSMGRFTAVARRIQRTANGKSFRFTPTKPKAQLNRLGTNGAIRLSGKVFLPAE